MTTRRLQTRVKAAVLAVCGIAAIAAAVAVSVPAVAARQSQLASRAAPAGVPVVIDCTGQPQVRPGQYILASGDGGARLCPVTPVSATSPALRSSTPATALTVFVAGCITFRPPSRIRYRNSEGPERHDRAG